MRNLHQSTLILEGHEPSNLLQEAGFRIVFVVPSVSLDCILRGTVDKQIACGVVFNARDPSCLCPSN